MASYRERGQPTPEELLDDELLPFGPDPEEDEAEEQLAAPPPRCALCSADAAEGRDICEHCHVDEIARAAREKAPCLRCGTPPRPRECRAFGVCQACVEAEEQEKCERAREERLAAVTRRFEESPHTCLGGCGEKMLEPATCGDCERKKREERRVIEIARMTLRSVPERLRWAEFDAPELLERVRDHAAIPRVRAAVDSDADRCLLVGNAGLGKSVLAVCWLRATSARREVEGMFVDAYALANARRNARLGEEAALVEAALEADLLVLDDLGSEPVVPSSPIAEIVHARHATLKTTLVTSGFGLDALEGRYGGGSFRRLAEDVEIIEFQAPKGAR
jgi:DNA replication protein DnaC